MALFLNTPCSPLTLRNHMERRALTLHEVQDYTRMNNVGPKVFDGVIPSHTPQFPNVYDVQYPAYRGLTVTLVWTRDANGNSRIHAYILGMVFKGRKYYQDYIDEFLAAGNHRRVTNIRNGRGNRNNRMRRAIKVQKEIALKEFYDNRAIEGHGTTIGRFYRRGLVNPIKLY